MLKKYATYIVLIAGVCWGCMGVFVTKLNACGVQSMEIVESRCIIASAVLFAVIFFYDKKLFRINWRHWWCFFGTGFLGITLFNYCYYLTIKASSLAVAAVLLYTAPIFVMIFSAILFKEKITKRKFTALVLTFAGCIMVSGIFDGNFALTGTGFAIGICSGIGYSLYTVFTRYALNYGYQPLTIQFYTFVFGMAGGAFLTDFGEITTAMGKFPTAVPVALIGISIFSTVLPNFLYNTAMQYVDNGKTSVMASIEPVVAIILGIILYHQIPTAIPALGMVLSLSGIVLVNTAKEDSVC